MEETVMNNALLAARCIAYALSLNTTPSTFFAVGATGYLDAKFIPEKPVSCGMDCFDRPFITFCFKLTEKDGTISYSVCTAFKRYSTGQEVWVNANNYGNVLFQSSAFTNDSFELLLRLLKGEKVLCSTGTAQLVPPREVRMSDPEATIEYASYPNEFLHDEPTVRLHVERPQVITTGA